MRVRPITASCVVGSSLLQLFSLGCGADAELRLGQGDPTPIFFDSGRPVPILNSPDSDDNDHNPTLTEDMLEIYFTSDRDGGLGEGDVWCAKRKSRAEPFSQPEPLFIASSPDNETSSAISADGKTLWVGSQRASGAVVDDDDDDADNDIWRTQRDDLDSPWEVPVNLTPPLNSDEDDIPRPVGLRGTVMPIASKRDTGTYETYLARRATPDGEFSDLEPITEISQAGSSTVDAFMTDDGLLIFFNREEDDGKGDLFMAWRRSTNEPFIQTVPLDALNTDGDERDPWVNADGDRFFFSSDRGEGDGLDIYMAFVQLPNVRDFPRP